MLGTVAAECLADIGPQPEIYHYTTTSRPLDVAPKPMREPLKRKMRLDSGIILWRRAFTIQTTSGAA